MNEIKTICVLGGGSAGALSALTLSRLLPGRKVLSVSAPDMPVIGVGESTTAYLPQFLHGQLQLDRHQFYTEVKPSWKLGIRFVWGPPERSHFNYPFSFDLSRRAGALRKRGAYYQHALGGSSGLMSLLMDRDLSPVLKLKGQYCLVDQPFGYHIDNPRFLAWLDARAAEHGVETVTGRVTGVRKDDSGNLTALVFDDGREVQADFFVDCSGFGSRLLRQEMGARFVDYAPSLRCNSALVGDIPRTGRIRPYTSAETMDSGWCWKIELPERVSVGYVYASDHIDDDAAEAELRSTEPGLKGELRRLRFPSGRHDTFWRGNVVGIGNASGFVEPLESTALHVICEQLNMVCAALLDSDYRIEPEAVADANRRYATTWDAIRDFLAVHYRFNTRRDTEFWRACRAETDLGGAAEIVRLYQEIGPHTAMKYAVPEHTLVQFEGYLALLMGQQVPTGCDPVFDRQDRADWQAYQDQCQAAAKAAVPLREALNAVVKPGWRW